MHHASNPLKPGKQVVERPFASYHTFQGHLILNLTHVSIYHIKDTLLRLKIL